MKDNELEKFLKKTEKKGIDHNKKLNTVLAVTEKFKSMRHKTAFSVFDVIFQHAGYISFQFWIYQFVFLLIALWMAYCTRFLDSSPRTMATFSILVPMISLLGFPEIIRSFSYGMWELEQSCPFNLRQLLSVKLFVVGAVDLLLFTLASIVAGASMNVPVFRILLYMLVPFNLCAFAFLLFFRYLKMKYVAISSSAIGAGLVFLVQSTDMGLILYESSMIWLWFASCLVTAVMLCNQGYWVISNIKKEEYYKWSFQSID